MLTERQVEGLCPKPARILQTVVCPGSLELPQAGSWGASVIPGTGPLGSEVWGGAMARVCRSHGQQLKLWCFCPPSPGRSPLGRWALTVPCRLARALALPAAALSGFLLSTYSYSRSPELPSQVPQATDTAVFCLGCSPSSWTRKAVRKHGSHPRPVLLAKRPVRAVSVLFSAFIFVILYFFLD